MSDKQKNMMSTTHAILASKIVINVLSSYLFFEEKKKMSH